MSKSRKKAIIKDKGFIPNKLYNRTIRRSVKNKFKEQINNLTDLDEIELKNPKTIINDYDRCDYINNFENILINNNFQEVLIKNRRK